MTGPDLDLGVLADQANAGNNENTHDVPSIRKWLFDFLVMLDEEFERFPEERDVAQWDLLAADHTLREPRAVVVTVFVDGTFTLFSGHGEGRAHFDFGEADDFPEDADGITAAAHEVFRLGPFTLRVESETVRSWSDSGV